jgi:hypothetical protein
MLWNEDIGPGVVNLSFFPRLCRWDAADLGPSSVRLATVICASLLATGMFIDSQSLVVDGASSDLAMVEVQRLFQRSSRRRWSLVAAASFSKCRKP